MLPRRKVRFWLYRLKAEAEGGAFAGPPDGLRDVYQAQAAFKLGGGWPGFSETWDIGEEDLETIIPLEKSIQQAWADHCAEVAKDLPVREDPTVQLPPLKARGHAEVTVKLIEG